MKCLIRISLMFVVCCVSSIESSDDLKKELVELKDVQHDLWSAIHAPGSDALVSQELTIQWLAVTHERFDVENHIEYLCRASPIQQYETLREQELQRRRDLVRARHS